MTDDKLYAIYERIAAATTPEEEEAAWQALREYGVADAYDPAGCLPSENIPESENRGEGRDATGREGTTEPAPRVERD